MISNLDAEINNNFFIIFDKTYKVKNFIIKIMEKFLKPLLKFDNLLENNQF